MIQDPEKFDWFIVCVCRGFAFMSSMQPIEFGSRASTLDKCLKIVNETRLFNYENNEAKWYVLHRSELHLFELESYA